MMSEGLNQVIVDMGIQKTEGFPQMFKWES